LETVRVRREGSQGTRWRETSSRTERANKEEVDQKREKRIKNGQRRAKSDCGAHQVLTDGRRKGLRKGKLL
jgi:hypothetical protein